MGRKTAQDIEALDGIMLEVKLQYHLQHNHYPPVSTVVIPACKQAIKNANAGKWDKRVRLPDGIRRLNMRTHRLSHYATTQECIDNWNLQWFLDSQEDESDSE